MLERYPIELSGGMKQRMVMVISTLLNPSLLIADEITSALDVSSQKAVAQTLVEFRDRTFVDSMIVVTHDVSILYQIADTLTVMYAGKLAEKAPTDVMMEAPLHPYTRLLISSLPEVGVRYEEKRLPGIPGVAARRCSTRRSAAASGIAARSPFEKCRRGASVRRGRARPLRRLLEGLVTC